MNTINWALVGTSGYAERECLPAFENTPTAHLAAIVSSTGERAAQFAAAHGIERGYSDIEAICKADDIAAVWIASPSYLHYDHARAAIAAGKHVLLEKPVASAISPASMRIRSMWCVPMSASTPQRAVSRCPRQVRGGPGRRIPYSERTATSEPSSPSAISLRMRWCPGT